MMKRSKYDDFTGEVIDLKKHNSLPEKFRQLDIYGFPVSLTHKSKRFYKTAIGSSFSIVTIIIVFTFIAMKLVTFI